MRAKPDNGNGTGTSDLAQQFVRERNEAGVVYVMLPDQLIRQGPGGQAPREVSADELRADVRAFLDGRCGAGDGTGAADRHQQVLDEVLQMCVGTPAPY